MAQSSFAALCLCPQEEIIQDRTQSFPSRPPLNSCATLRTLVIQDPRRRLSGPDLLSIFLFRAASVKVANLHTLLIGGGQTGCVVRFAAAEAADAAQASVVGAALVCIISQMRMLQSGAGVFGTGLLPFLAILPILPMLVG